MRARVCVCAFRLVPLALSRPNDAPAKRTYHRGEMAVSRSPRQAARSYNAGVNLQQVNRRQSRINDRASLVRNARAHTPTCINHRLVYRMPARQVI